MLNLRDGDGKDCQWNLSNINIYACLRCDYAKSHTWILKHFDGFVFCLHCRWKLRSPQTCAIAFLVGSWLRTNDAINALKEHPVRAPVKWKSCLDISASPTTLDQSTNATAPLTTLVNLWQIYRLYCSEVLLCTVFFQLLK